MPYSNGTTTNWSSGPTMPRSTWEILADYLDRPGSAIRAGLFEQYKNPLNPVPAAKAMWGALKGDKHTYTTEILDKMGMKPGWTRSGLGFAGDIALDPLTYIPSSWLGKAGKVIGMGGKALGAGVEKAAVAVPKLAPAVDAAKVVGKTTKDWLGHTFVNGYGLPEPFRNMRRLVDAKLRGLNGEVAQRIYDIASPYDEAARKGALIHLEKGNQTGAALELGEKLRPIFSDLFDREVKAGLQNSSSKIRDYAPYIFKQHDKWTFASPYQSLKAKLPFANKRSIQGGVEEAIKRGAQPDAAIAGFHRIGAGERSIATAEFIKDVADKFGQYVKRGDTVPEGFVTLRGHNKAGMLADQNFWNQRIQIQGKLVKLKDVALPGEIMDDLVKHYIRLPKDARVPEWITRAGSNLNRIFREGATVLRPGFHLTNLQGNVFNMGLAGMDPVSSLVGTARQGMGLARGEHVISDIGKYTAAQIKDAIERYNISSPYSTFTGQFIKEDDLLAKLAKSNTPKNLLQRGYANWRRGMSKLGSSIEGGSKEALFLNEVKKGKTLDEAAATVNKYLFDYGDLTHAESKIRNVLPFYTWSRKNIPLQAEMVMRKPRIYGGIDKFKHAIEDITAGQGKFIANQDRPSYLREDGAIQLPFSPKGAARYWNPYLPYKDVNVLPTSWNGLINSARQILSMTTPFFKIPIEAVTNKQFLSGRPLYNENLGYFGDWRPSRTMLGLRVPVAADHAFGNINPALPYVTNTIGNLASGDIGNILSSLGIRVPLRNAAQVRKDATYERAARKQYRAANVRMDRQKRELPDDSRIADILRSLNSY